MIDTFHYIFLSAHTRANPKVNYRLWVVAMCQCRVIAGSLREESRLWQRSWGRKPDKMQRRDLASGVPPEFSWTSTPQNQSLPALLLCFSLFWHSGKKLIEGFGLLHQLKPLWWLSNLPDRFPRTSCSLWIAYSPPTARGTKLKAS